MRCLTLARQLSVSGWECSFVIGPGTAQILPALQRSDFIVSELITDGDTEAIERLSQGNIDLFIVDDYCVDKFFETKCRAFANRILAIDDLANRKHDCDLILDASPGRTAEAYQDLVPKKCRFLLGPEYALLRPEFAKKRSDSLKRREGKIGIERVLVSFGLTDPAGASLLAVQGLIESGTSARIDVILGMGAPAYTRIATLAARYSNIKLWEYVEDMPELMTQADFTIGAAGTTSWERCCLGIPTIIIIVADNQVLNAEGLAAAGSALNLGKINALRPADVSRTVVDIIENDVARQSMSKSAAGLCDGLGVRRLVQELEGGRQAADGQAVRLRPAGRKDAAIVFKWQNDQRVRKYFRNSMSPKLEEHLNWFENRLLSSIGPYSIITYGDVPVGTLRLDDKGDGRKYEISIYVAPDYWGRGIASAALALADDLIPEAEFVAEVHSDNQASHAIFSKTGYKITNKGQYVLKPRNFG